jgi:hypothetical protein
MSIAKTVTILSPEKDCELATKNIAVPMPAAAATAKLEFLLDLCDPIWGYSAV